MKWQDFEKEIKTKNIKLFTPSDVQQATSRSKTAVVFLLYRLKKQGRIESVKRGLYKLLDEHISELYLANKIYEPSYVSLEFALSYHRIIPENVYEITSITTKATRRFETLGKVFSYRKVQKNVFTGYTIEKQNDVSFRIADAEKAFVDYSYFRLIDGNEPLSRFDKTKIDMKKALHYAKAFNNQKLTDTIQTILT
ncbi:MAG TPA: hypothetical protein VI937_02265 [Negativicutes bacterium]|nr:hypothetical protein [Negativicutes bacterium]